MITRAEYLHMYSIVGAAMEVFNHLGHGMDEPIYQEALSIELTLRSIPFEREKLLHTYYKGQQLQKYYQADFYSQGVMIELKSVSKLISEHRAQLFNCMRITHTTQGLLINFGEKSLRTERYIYDKDLDDFILLSEQNLQDHVK